VTRRGSPRVEGYALLAAVGVVAALALRRPELAAVAAPFALLLALGTGLSREPRIDASLAVSASRALEHDEVEAELAVRSATGVDLLEIALDLPRHVEVADGDDACALRLVPGEERVLRFVLHPTRWGAYDVGAVALRAVDRLGLVLWEHRLSSPTPLTVYPRPESVGRLFSAVELQASSGNEVARVAGDGIEYADLRDFVPGDRVRSINWRASARRSRLVVNERHPERNTDVVLLVDSFVDLAFGGRSTLDDAVRAAATLAERFLARRDRVGLVGFGGVMRWLRPGMGSTQRYRLVETLLETRVETTYAVRDVNVVPARILPPKALVVALTPLVDPRFATAVEDLRARRFDLVVVEIDPARLVPHGRGRSDELAFRLWLLERDVTRIRLERVGIGVARWGDDGSLDAALEGVRTYRRYARTARA
jgi:uncharacterized protein (DUF58 family)